MEVCCTGRTGLAPLDDLGLEGEELLVALRADNEQDPVGISVQEEEGS